MSIFSVLFLFYKMLRRDYQRTLLFPTPVNRLPDMLKLFVIWWGSCLPVFWPLLKSFDFILWPIKRILHCNQIMSYIYEVEIHFMPYFSLLFVRKPWTIWHIYNLFGCRHVLLFLSMLVFFFLFVNGFLFYFKSYVILYVIVHIYYRIIIRELVANNHSFSVELY